MVRRSMFRWSFQGISLLTLFGITLALGSCKGYFTSTIYPAYLQRSDKVIHLSDIPEVFRVLKGQTFQARLLSLSFNSERYLVIQVLFKEKAIDDLLILLTEDLQYKQIYDRSTFQLPFGYKMGTLFSPGYGNRILIGFEYVGDNPTLQSQLVAFDPTGSEVPIIQADPNGVCVSFQGGIPTLDSGGGTWIVQVFNNNSLNFTLLPATYTPPALAPPASGTNVQVFSSNAPLFTISQYVKDPVRNQAALLFRAVNQNDERGWVVYRLPLGAPVTITPLVSDFNYTSPYGNFRMDAIFRDDLYFYTVDGIVRLSDEGPWLLFPFKVDPVFSILTVSTSEIEGPTIRIDKSQVYHFTVDGRWFYIFDTETLRVTRARTWW
ncbi:MAG: hypothetical protein N2442_10295 [Spirochaetes bacterium]|nr:hypothetical protein [Spirochaetota bacterium]